MSRSYECANVVRRRGAVRAGFRFVRAACRLLLLVACGAIPIGSDAEEHGPPNTSQPKAPRQLLFEQSFDPNREVRVAALERLRDIMPDDTLRQRVNQMAELDSDPVVRGHARLLAADWGAGPPRSRVAENNLPSARFDGLPMPSWSDSNQQSPQEFGYQKTQLNPQGVIDGSAPRLDYEIAPAGFDGNVRRQPAQSDEVRPTGASSSFTPVTPYWLSTDKQYNSLPSDVDRPDYSRPEYSRPDNSRPDNGRPDYGRPSYFSQVSSAAPEPGILRRPIDAPEPETFPGGEDWNNTLLLYEMEAPLGFTGPSGVLPTEFQRGAHFAPIEDRWRIGFPSWDRYSRGHPRQDDYPYMEGRWWDPYNQNLLKGDFPIIGQHTFLNVTATSFMLHEYRQSPLPTTPFESTVNPFSEPFFGSPNQYFYSHFFRLAVDLFHGNEAFKPFDWQVRIEPVFNVNYLAVEELGIVNPDVRRGTHRARSDFALEQWFVEAKLADLSPDYDFLSARAGSQFFVSDFRGFVFADTNLGVRLFGTRLANRDQFNAIFFDQTDKDTNSMLNNFDDRHQNTLILNYFRQDFIFPGYTGEISFHYNRDGPSFKFDDNDFLVRPDPAGSFRQHRIDAYYIGLGGEGHIGRVNIMNQFYVALGTDSMNPIASEQQKIMAQMAAIELSYDRDWVRFRTSYFFSSGDNNPNDRSAGGFDTILDNPVFAGGEFSYWQRQSIKLFGVNLVQRNSLVPDLRSSKIQGQSNFVNPGLHLFNVGMDFEVTPKMKVITNANYLMFDTTQVLEAFTFQDHIGRDIGTDISVGIEYRPLLNDNLIFVLGSAVLIPADGLRDLFGTQVPPDIAALVAKNTGRGLKTEIPTFQSYFLEMVLTY